MMMITEVNVITESVFYLFFFFCTLLILYINAMSALGMLFLYMCKNIERAWLLCHAAVMYFSIFLRFIFVKLVFFEDVIFVVLNLLRGSL